MKYIASLFIILLSSSAIGEPVPAGSGKLVVTVSGFNSDKGSAIVSLFKEKGFLDDSKALDIINAEIKDKEATVTFKNVSFGEYAVGAIHDEDSNGKLNTNWLGIPKEGTGVTNDAKGSMGAPEYKDAKIIFEKDGQAITFHMSY